MLKARVQLTLTAIATLDLGPILTGASAFLLRIGTVLGHVAVLSTIVATATANSSNTPVLFGIGAFFHNVSCLTAVATSSAATPRASSAAARGMRTLA